MDLVHNGGEGFGLSPLFTFFFTFQVKIMSKNWKRMIKQWWEKNIVHIRGGGGVSGELD